jgi:sortase A
MRLAKVLGALGRACITVGTLLLLFVVYQLWGTGIREAQAQNRLEGDFEQLLDEGNVPTTTPDIETVPSIPAQPEGEVTAVIEIPEIGLEKHVVEGVAVSDLKKGPGHYPETPLPGQEGNAAIAGHRTTYGAPFNRIDELEKGDEIFVQTLQGRFRYLVEEQLIVSPSQVEVLEDKGDDRLTLTACHPKYSARQRIVVVAMLGPDQAPLPSNPVGDVTFEEISEGGAIWTTVLYGLLCASIWLFAWALGRLWRKWPAYVVALPFFMVGLFYFFEEFSQVLPANY